MAYLGLYGAGNMAEAILKGLLDNELLSENEIIAYEINEDRKEYMNKKYSLRFAEKEEEFFSSIEICVLAIKPQSLGALEGKTSVGNFKGDILSILAGVKIEKIASVFKGAGITRIMPNTPCLVGEGAVGFSFDDGTKAETREFVKKLFDMIGTGVEVKEELLDAVTGLSGSGPAFVYQFIEALGDAGVYCGLSREDSYKLACQTIIGSAKMVMETKLHPAELKDKVTSPKGTTIEGIKALEANGFRNATIEAVISAFKKSQELGR